MHSRHLIGDRTDSADAGRQIGNLFERTTAEEGLEKTRRFVNGEFDVADGGAVERNVERPFAFDAGESFNTNGACVGHAVIIAEEMWKCAWNGGFHDTGRTA